MADGSATEAPAAASPGAASMPSPPDSVNKFQSAISQWRSMAQPVPDPDS